MRPHLTEAVNPLAKVSLVIAGYAWAAAIAAAAVACHQLVFGGPQSPAYGGMNAFGDSLLFLAVFGIAALAPTGVALFFLRPYHAFWRGLSVLALVFALTSLAACIVVTVHARSVMASMAFPRILAAPLFSLNLLVSVFFAPNRTSRIALLVATGIEIMGFIGWVGTCILRNF